MIENKLRVKATMKQLLTVYQTKIIDQQAGVRDVH